MLPPGDLPAGMPESLHLPAVVLQAQLLQHRPEWQLRSQGLRSCGGFLRGSGSGGVCSGTGAGDVCGSGSRGLRSGAGHVRSSRSSDLRTRGSGSCSGKVLRHGPGPSQVRNVLLQQRLQQ
jgi:hypothetical protein